MYIVVLEVKFFKSLHESTFGSYGNYNYNSFVF